MHTRSQEISGSVAVVGAGFMGWQIALQSAVHGHTVTLIDSSDKALSQAAEHVKAELERRMRQAEISAQQQLETLQRLRYSIELAPGVLSVSIVIEAIPERLELKRELFHRLDQLCPEHTVIATNSSSLRISEIESATMHKHRLLNMHFYGLIWEKPMVELMRGSATSDKTVEAARVFAESIGMTPLFVRKESTGFLFNRVWRVIKKESLQVADQGVATLEDVDRAWMLFMNHQIGPFGIMDTIGLDVVRDIEMVYYRQSGDPADAPPKFLLDKVERGDLGVKTGKGFYEYPNPAFQQQGFLRRISAK